MPHLAITPAAIAGLLGILGDERPVFSGEIVCKLANTGIAVDNEWVIRMGGGPGPRASRGPATAHAGALLVADGRRRGPRSPVESAEIVVASGSVSLVTEPFDP
jgi:hypothetical protein